MDPNLSKGCVDIYPHAKLTGIQFGLLSTEHFRKISVYDRKGECRLEVNDSRLGLPNQEFMCKSCGESHPMKCEGHFGHIVLTNAVYHPNYVSQIVKILNRLCLSCLSLKVKMKKSLKGMEVFMEMIDDSMDCDIDEKPKMRKHNSPSMKGKGKIVQSAPSTYSAIICRPKMEPAENSEMLMIDDKEFIMNSEKLALVPLPQISECNEPSQNVPGRFQKSCSKVVIDLSSDEEENTIPPLNTSTLRHTVNGDQRNNVESGRPNSSQKPANANNDGDAGKSKCKYCKQGSYPKVSIKLESSVLTDNQRNNTVVEKICVEFDEEDPSVRDYLKNLGKTPEDFDTGKEYLLPSEALKILKKISDQVVTGMKIDSKIARPEGLVLESILIPPNCNRIPEKPGVSQWKFGSDEITKKLRAILRFKHSQDRKMARMISIEKMQALISHYFRLKGAPKVRGNKEPVSEYASRAQSKKEIRKSSCTNKLHDLIVAKVCSFSARAVLTGDAFLSLDEIGIPIEVSKGLTVWETVTQHNFENMKNEYNQVHGYFRALMYIRSGVKTDLTQCEVYNVEIGDEVARPIKDGDLVFCNRPPSVHKHSLIGLKVRILDIPTFAINPLICPPMGADFDGDCLAVFVPQSMESRAEVDLAMAENQMLTSHGGVCTFGLTQDSLLAAHKLTSSQVLIKKETMEQGCLWSDSWMPKPAIIKSPKGAFFTGSQFYQLPLPQGFDYSEPGVLISGSEILESRGQVGWLGNSNGLLRSIVERYGCHVALNYLSSCQIMLTLWLSQVGFSIGLRDVYETCKSKTRGGMKNEIRKTFDEFEYRSNAKIQSLNCLTSKQEEYMNGHIGKLGMQSPSFDELRIQYMQELISRIQDVILKYVPEENSMMRMVAAGSKGSVKKFVEQFGCVGFQSLRGKHKLISERDRLVENSFVEGLTPHEFMMQTISFRDSAIYQALRVSEPGVLFKNLMLFGRDVHIYYDGTVRNHHHNHIIQFLYGGLQACKEDNKVKNPQKDPKYLAGEPVGILAAMAIAQPAYEALLESAKVSANNTNSCPLEYLQDTLYCQKVLKKNDRKVILFMSESLHVSSKEKSAIHIQNILRHVDLEMLLISTSLIYAGDSEFWEGLLPAKNSPWIVHLSLSEVALTTWNLTVKEVVQKLKRNNECEGLSFHSRDQCDSSCPDSRYLLGSACISFCISHGQLSSVVDPLSDIRDKIIPSIKKISISGDRRVESISILPSGMSSERWATSMQREPCRDSEVAVEITLKETCVKKKSDAWHIVKELCIPVLDLIDWSLSMPCSVQGIFEIYGIEAAQKFIFQRLKAILGMFDKTIYPEHVLLVADMMSHAGKVVGLTHSGLRDFINAIHVSAPMTHGLFKNPVKHIQDAAVQGKCDDLSGTLPSICWGKLAPLGTGANFEILWRKLGS